MSFDKKVIKKACLDFIQDKISYLELEIKSTQDSVNNETKSSAGDKHETSRAMAQIENERLSNQLNLLLVQKKTLLDINTSIFSKEITLGSFVVTDKGHFFISTGLGRISQPFDFFAISKDSPLGQELLGKSNHDCFKIANSSYTIHEIH